MNNAAEKNARILIVDDSEMNRDMLSDMLSDDYDIVEAANGEEALGIQMCIRDRKNVFNFVIYKTSCL